MWKLTPVTVVGASMPPCSSFETLEPGPLPSYEKDSGGSSIRTQHAESERDKFGTIVSEVTVLTTTVTTTKRYRLEDA